MVSIFYNGGFGLLNKKMLGRSLLVKRMCFAVLGAAMALSGIANARSVFDAVVAQDGSGDYRTVQDALDAAPVGKARYRIYIKNGVYFEKLRVNKANISLVGESSTGTRLSYNQCSSDAGGTAKSASMTVLGAGFTAENLTIENTFDYDKSAAKNKQAVALLTQADRLTFRNCRILGHQDTLDIRSPGRQYFKNCYIEGHVDLIFGEGNAVFFNCTIHSLLRDGSSVTAPATLASQPYGLIFIKCKFTGADGMNGTVYLGRPWHPSSAKAPVRSSTVLIDCILGSHIAAKGWTGMSGVQPEGERLAEYQSSGVGAVINENRPQLTAVEAANYSVAAVLGGRDHWEPAKN
jgi:pectin methylesterase-like acyl-CoA thioesterase